MKQQGQFIVFEGLDGSGQSTQVNLLAEFLQSKGANVLTTKEPTQESRPSKRIKKALDEKQGLSAKELQQLFADDRKWHLNNVIKPALQQGKVVISDRYFFSSFAYGMSDGLDFEWLKKINKGFLMPDIVFFLDVSPETCIQRIESRGGGKKLFEKLEKLKKVSKTYKKALNDFEDKTRIHIINGEPSIETVFNQIKNLPL